MEKVYICPNCGKRTTEKRCDICKTATVNSGYSIDEWNALPDSDRDRILLSAMNEEARKNVSFDHDINKRSDDASAGFKIENVISVLAYVDFICWFILGCLTKDAYGAFQLSGALVYWAVGLVSGVMLLGFAEIIILLRKIASKPPKE